MYFILFFKYSLTHHFNYSAHMEQRSLDAYYDPNFQCEELQGLISKGIQMADKLKMWYTRKHAQYDYTVQVSHCFFSCD